MKLDLAIQYCRQRSKTMHGIGHAWLQRALDANDAEIILDMMVIWFHMEWTGECWIPCQHLPLWKMTDDCQSYVACRKCEMILKPPEIEVIQ